MAAFWSELTKARRRHDLPVVVILAVIAVVWASGTKPRTVEDLACGYSVLYYALPVINTVLLPTGTAVLASRIWDVETKGAACKLLFTLQSRASLFAAKVALGLLELAAVCVIELGGVFCMASFFYDAQSPDPIQLGWLTLCTYAVSVMLYFFELFLSIRYANQFPALAFGVGGSFVGLFTSYMPPALSYFVPWGYYTLLDGMGMGWDPDTRQGWYYPLPFRWPVLLLAAALTALFCLLGWRALKHKEV